MSLTYTNRKGQTYYLCQGLTKTGKSRYYFAREPKGVLASTIPDGYQVQENVNGIVSLAKTRPMVLSEEEINTVAMALQKHPNTSAYRMESKAKQITIYERMGTGLIALASTLTVELGIGNVLGNDRKRRLQEEEHRFGQFTPIMRFLLVDDQRRLFTAQRMCFRGSMEGWRSIEYNKSIAKLASGLIPTLGTEAFFELV
ncbi:MAG: hypothetical protein HY694_05550 [Deltaproteobacteria bacterium]|nr:hypothetical protein [Deltaproteobacteria bacterium]